MEIKKIPLSLVIPSPMNPRKTFDEDELQELADNIEKQGLLQPITVRPIADKRQFAVVDGNADFHPEYELICGERRFRAFSKLSDKWAEMNAVAPKGFSYNSFSEIPAIVREMNDDEAFEAMITENLQRKDVDPMEEAFAFGQLIQKGKTAEEIAARFGKSIRFVQDRVKLNSLIPELMVAVKEDNMSISAAMIIAKLNEDNQRSYHSVYSKNSAGFTRQTAESFTSSLFMSIEKSPWFQTDNQEDEDYDGGCGCKCSECQLNTANHGCLFWDMKVQDAGKCTNREKFYAKHTAFILDKLNNYELPLIRKGSPLETGKVIIIDEDEWCNPATKELKKSIYEKIKDAGYEVIKSADIFEGKCWYTDDRLQRNIEMGRVYQCLKIFTYDEVRFETQWRYFKGKSKTLEDTETQNDTPATSSQSADAMRLVQQRNRTREIALEKITAESREMAVRLGEAKRKGELSDAEMFAFQTIVFTLCGNQMLKRYGHTGLGKPSDRSLINTIRQNRADWPMWIREFIRNTIASADIAYNGLYQFCAGEVLKEWMPKEHTELVHKIAMKLDKDLAKNAEKLKALGYDANGKLLPTSDKPAPGNTKPKSKKKAAQADAEYPTMEYVENLRTQYPTCLLLFRVGDSYECYDQDAEDLDMAGGPKFETVTKWGQEILLNHFPAKDLDSILPILKDAGHKVALFNGPETHK